MRQVHPVVSGILFAFALFTVCACAGYLLIILNNQQPPPAVAQNVAPNQPEVGADNPVEVVQVVPTTTPFGTPLALLPTITAQPPTPTSIPATPLSTATQEPIPTSSNQTVDLEILNHQSHIDSLGWYHIVGEVQNNGIAPAEFVEVVAKLYDNTNQVIGTKLTFTAPDTIFPGAKAPFDIITLRRSQWEKIDDYTLQVKGDVTDIPIQQNLTIINQNTWLEDDFLYVDGEVQNNGDSQALVKLIITLYDVDLNVVNTNWTYVDDGILPTGQVSAFQLKIDTPTDIENFHYRIQIEEAIIETE